MRLLHLLAALLVLAPLGEESPVVGQDASTPSVAGAQPPAADAPQDASEPEQPSGRKPLEPSSLDTFLLRDSKGNLVPVLGLLFEEFEQLLKMKKGLAPTAPPPYSLDSLTVTGTVEGELAQLDVSAKIRLRESGWVRVPLRFNKAVLRQATTYEGGGEHFVRYEEQDGYVCWLTGAGDKPHVVNCRLTLPVSRLGLQSSIGSILPRATESSLKLLVPVAKAEAELKGSGEGLVFTQESGERTEIQVLGAGGELSLNWRPGQKLAGGTPASLEAAGEILVKVEGRYRVSSDARLLVRSLSGPLHSLRVRLPEFMELIPASSTGYTVTVVEQGSESPADHSQVVEIKLDRPTTGTVEIRLLAALALPAATGESLSHQRLEPCRFEVLSAVRQRGIIDFTVDGDWSLSWTQNEGTRRIPAATADNGAASSQARFEYFRQPSGLKVSIEPRPTRIAVEPTYVVHVEPKLLRLEATFKYRIRGAGTESLEVALGDWVFAKVDPETIVEVESLDPSSRKLVLPLRSRALTGEFEIRLEAHQVLPEGSLEWSFLLPRPAADVITPASVIVVPSDNVELTPKAREITGLVADSQPLQVTLPRRQQTPLAYRDRGIGGEARFVGQSQIRTRQTTVAAAARLQFTDRTVQVEQTLAYRIFYEPQQLFRFQVPRSLLRGDLKVLHDSEVLPMVPLADSDGESSRLARVQVSTSAEQIGPCELTLQYTLNLPALSADQTATMAVPLVIPDEVLDQAELGQTVLAQWSDGLLIELATASRSDTAGPLLEASSSKELRATSNTLSSEWRFQLRTSDPDQSRRLLVSKMWLQSLLQGEIRQERAVWRLSTGSAVIKIRLPPRAEVQVDQVAVNRRRVIGRMEGELLAVPVPPATEDLVVEVWYSVPQTTAGLSLSALIPPVLVGASQARQCYWQLCTPAREHLLLEPASFTEELTWQWRGLFWERMGMLDQAALEEWIGCSKQAPLPAEMNTYLFSVFRSPPGMSVFILARSVLLWSIGAIVLVIGLALLNVRAVRRPSMILFLAILLAAAGLSWPTAALLLAQGASVALLIVALAAFWQWSLTGQSPYAAPLPPPAPAQEPKSTATSPAPRSEQPAPRSGPPPSTTATAPLAAMTEPQP